MGKCFHPREDIKASKRIRPLNSRFVRSQIIQKAQICFLFLTSLLHQNNQKDNPWTVLNFLLYLQIGCQLREFFFWILQMKKHEESRQHLAKPKKISSFFFEPNSSPLSYFVFLNLESFLPRFCADELWWKVSFIFALQFRQCSGVEMLHTFRWKSLSRLIMMHS